MRKRNAAVPEDGYRTGDIVQTAAGRLAIVIGTGAGHFRPLLNIRFIESSGFWADPGSVTHASLKAMGSDAAVRPREDENALIAPAPVP